MSTGNVQGPGGLHPARPQVQIHNKSTADAQQPFAGHRVSLAPARKSSFFGSLKNLFKAPPAKSLNSHTFTTAKSGQSVQIASVNIQFQPTAMGMRTIVSVPPNTQFLVYSLPPMPQYPPVMTRPVYAFPQPAPYMNVMLNPPWQPALPVMKPLPPGYYQPMRTSSPPPQYSGNASTTTPLPPKPSKPLQKTEVTDLAVGKNTLPEHVTPKDVEKSPSELSTTPDSPDLIDFNTPATTPKQVQVSQTLEEPTLLDSSIPDTIPEPIVPTVNSEVTNRETIKAPEPPVPSPPKIGSSSLKKIASPVEQTSEATSEMQSKTVKKELMPGEERPFSAADLQKRREDIDERAAKKREIEELKKRDAKIEREEDDSAFLDEERGVPSKAFMEKLSRQFSESFIGRKPKG